MALIDVVEWLFGDWCGVGLTVTVFLVTWWLWTTLTARLKLPPGPFPWPLLGHLPSIMMQPDYSYEYFRKLSEKYGPLVSVKVGPSQLVIVNSYEGFKNTLMKYQNEFAGRPQVVSSELVSEGGKDIAFGDFGPAWSLHRKLAMTALKHFAAKDILTELVNDEIRQGVDKMTANGKTGIDLHDYIYDILYSVLSRIIFGHDMELQEKNDMIKNIRVISESFGSGLFQDFLPLWIGRHIPSPGRTKIGRLMKKMMAVFYSHADDHRKNFNRDNIGDLLDGILLAQLELKESGGDDMTLFTNTHLVNTISDIFFAASDTTAYTLLWTFLYLAKYPDIQEKLRQSIKEVAGDRALVLADKPKLPYVEAVLSEVFRMRPIAPLSVGHTTTTDVTVEAFDKSPECTIPKGTLVFPNIWSCHHDPAVWGDDHDQFRPERFLTEDGTKFVKREGLVPFSVGRRQCLGEQIARQDLFLLLAGIIQRVRIKSTGHLPGTEGNPGGGALFLIPLNYKVIVERI